MKQNVLPVLSFFVFAFTLSWLTNKFIPPVTVGPLDIKTILTGLGPALSGLLCYAFFKTPNTYHISLGGARPLLSYGLLILAVLVPLLMSQDRTNKAILTGSILTQLMYTLGEEVGWRHYLQNATRDFSKWGQALVIGVLWFLWHYSILNDPTTMLTGQAIPFYLGIPGLIILLTLLSQLLGSIVIRTQAVLLPTLIHYIGKVGSGSAALIIISLVLAIYLVWPKFSVKEGPTII